MRIARGTFPDEHAYATGSATGDVVIASSIDVWHFVCDERKGLWTWKRVSPDGSQVAQSPYSFASFNVCVADAERAGYANNTASIRRVWDPARDVPTPGLSGSERRRRARSRDR